MDVTSDAANLQPVDFFPFLRPWYRIMPLWMSSYKRSLKGLVELEKRLFNVLLDNAKEMLASGKKYPSKHIVLPPNPVTIDQQRARLYSGHVDR